MSELRQKATKGILWSFIDQFARQGISFIIGIILARILAPDDYGLIGMLSIFMAVAQTFIDSGFNSALVQKVNRTEADFSTVFYFNLAISAILYLILFSTAPWIAAFYKAPLLEPITRVVALNFVIGALSMVSHTKLLIAVDFKTQTKVSLISVFVSGIAGITLAYSGFGVWALVIQTLISNIAQTFLYWFYVKWKPIAVFSKSSFKQLFGYGSKLLASGLLDTIYTNIYTIVIGKVYSAAELGYYSRAQQLQALPAQNLTGVLQRVTFPIFCSIQDDNERLIAAYRKLIRLTAFIVFPLMIMLAAVAKPLIIILLTAKWLPVVDLFQILCFAGMLYPLHAINLNILQAKGRSDLFLRLEIWKKVMGTIVLLITIPMGLKAMIIGQVVSSVIALFMNTWYSGKHFNYGIFKQVKDIYLFFLVSMLLGAGILFLLHFTDSNWIKLIFGVSLYSITYFLIAKLFNSEELNLIVPVMIKPLNVVLNQFKQR